MTVATDDMLRIVALLQYFTAANEHVNVYHYKSLGPGETDAQSLINLGIVIENLYLQVNANMVDEITYKNITIYNVTQDSLVGVTPWPTLVNGLNAGDAVPSQIAALVLGHTGTLGHQGRKYLTGFQKGFQVQSGWTAPHLTALANFGTQYIETKMQGGITYEPGVLSNTVPAVFRGFTSTSAITVCRTQRRRSVGFGT